MGNIFTNTKIGTIFTIIILSYYHHILSLFLAMLNVDLSYD